MNQHVIYLSIPGLRSQDLAAMPNLSKLCEGGERAPLTPTFPAVTWPVHASILTGKRTAEHGVIGNGFYWRDKQEIEMWTAWNDKITAPQLWDRLHEKDPQLTSAVWFPMLSKGAGADYICMPAPIHNPDGSESLWCYTKPVEMYGTLRDTFGHFPLMNFWGPMANIKSTAWIADTAAWMMREKQPRFFFIYLPHLDYAAQKTGPDSPEAHQAVAELDEVIGKLVAAGNQAYGAAPPLWIAASEYVITPVDHVSYPNRMLRQAELLHVKDEGEGELIDLAASRAWALVDHQFSHIFVKDAHPASISEVAGLFRGQPSLAEVLVGDERAKYGMNHERSGEVILISQPNSWQAYYYWLDDAQAPQFARTVDIHRKPGYDPVELHFDFATKSIPLDATLVKGSHGAPATSDAQRGILLTSQAGILDKPSLTDTDIAALILRQLGAA